MSSDPDWLEEVLGVRLPGDGTWVDIAGQRFTMLRGTPRSTEVVSDQQEQTADAFGFKWDQRQTFESGPALERAGRWLRERYGDVTASEWWRAMDHDAVVLDAGCGASMSALELFGDALRRVRYLGVDISTAVDVAAARCAERSIPARFLQCSLLDVPLPHGSVDVVFAEGVLHHTDSTRDALLTLARLLKPGGRFLFYVYRRKGPVREFTDDYVRQQIAGLPPEEAWAALAPLTRLGQALGELGVTIEVPEAVDLLGIPAGPIDLQRFFYWHVCKAYHHPDLSFEELLHINYDWFAPANAHRQSPEEVRAWCADAGLVVEHEDVQEAGITVIARRPGAG